MAGHVLQVKGDEQVRALLPLLLTRAQRRAILPSKCGCFVGGETAVHSAVGSDAVALWWGCKLNSVLPGEKDSQSFRPAVVLVK